MNLHVAIIFYTKSTLHIVKKNLQLQIYKYMMYFLIEFLIWQTETESNVFFLSTYRMDSGDKRWLFVRSSGEIRKSFAQN